MDDIIINKENRKVKIIKNKDKESVQGENNNIYPQRIGRPKIIKEEGEIYAKRKVGRPKKENALSVKDYNKQYYQANKEKHKVYMRAYYLNKKGIVVEPFNHT